MTNARQVQQLLSAVEVAGDYKAELGGDTVARHIWDSMAENNRKAARGLSRRSFRHHPALVRWALSRLCKDGRARYEEWREVLPSLRSSSYLQDLKGFFPVKPGAPHEVNGAWRARAVSLGYEPHSWGCTGMLAFGAMAMKEDWEVDPLTGDIAGLPSIGESAVVAGLDRLNKMRDGDGPSADILPAKNWLVFFFVGFGDEPIAFSVEKVVVGSITAADIYDHVRRLTTLLWFYGFLVVLTCADGAGENRSYEQAAGTMPASDFGLADVGDLANNINIAFQHPCYLEVRVRVVTRVHADRARGVHSLTPPTTRLVARAHIQPTTENACFHGRRHSTYD